MMVNGRINPDFGKAFPCKCVLQTFEERRRERLLKYCSLPDNADPRTFENYEVKPEYEGAYRAALDFLNGDVIFLTFAGPVNTGKTHLAIAICREFLDKGVPAKFFSCGFFLRELRRTFDKDAEYAYQDVFNRVCTIPLIVLDDLFEDRMTEWGIAEIEAVINARYISKLATIITTNKTFNEMGIISDRVS